MPRWKSLCKPGEEPSKFVDTSDFGKVFDIKSGFGPADSDAVMKWNRCWSAVPEEWVPAIRNLLSNIRSKYRVETVEDAPDNPDIQVWIDQIKDKFGSLRFYYTVVTNEIYDDIDKMVEECEEELKKADPFYGVPY